MIRTVAGLRWYHWVLVVALAANSASRVGTFAGFVGGVIMAYLIVRFGVGAWRRVTGGRRKGSTA